MFTKIGLTELTLVSRDEADTDLLLMSIPSTSTDRLWCYWYVN